jgi:hypothetical protein
MFSPSAASDRMRKGMRMARKAYSSASSGTPITAKASSSVMPTRSCVIGKTCESFVYEVLN